MKTQPFPYAFFDGKIVPIEDAKVSVMTHSVQYGNAIFSGIRGYYNEAEKSIYAFRPFDHYQRIAHSANILGCPLPYSLKELHDITVKLIKKNKPTTDVYLRLYMYVDSLDLGPNLADKTFNYSVYMIPLQEYMPLDRGLRVMVSSWQRISDNTIPSRGKISGGYINSSLARKEATDNGFDEALMLNGSGHVAEGSAENLFIVRDGKLITPDCSQGILEGMTRRSVLQIAADMKIPVIERPIERSELYFADEVFLTGTACQVAWVEEIDRRTIGDGKIGPITKKLQDTFFAIVRGKEKKYTEWCTKIV
jgi:branched-chain amino acid aminotransferase